MKKYFAFGIMAAMVLSGCQKAKIADNSQTSQSFYATIEDAGTKTSLDGLNVLWKQGDQVSIFNASTINEKWQVTDESAGSTSAGLYDLSSSGFFAGGEIANNVAYYPYASTNRIALKQRASEESISDGNVYVIGNITLPAAQDYTADSFGNGMFPMVAVTSTTSDNKLKFKNVCGALKLQLKGTATIASISVCGNNNEILCGAASVTASNGNTPTIALTDASAKTVTLNCGVGVQLNSDTATSFIIVLPPVVMTGGFTVTVNDTEGKTMELKTTLEQTIKRNTILKMPALTYEGGN